MGHSGLLAHLGDAGRRVHPLAHFHGAAARQQEDRVAVVLVSQRRFEPRVQESRVALPRPGQRRSGRRHFPAVDAGRQQEAQEHEEDEVLVHEMRRLGQAGLYPHARHRQSQTRIVD